LKAIALVFSLAVVVLLVFLTQGFCTVWKDNISLWSNVVKHYPQTDVAYNNRGGEYFNLKEYEKALRDFLTAIDINGQYGDAYINICNVYFVKNEHEKAIPYCSAALKINAAQPNTYAILGDIYWSRDKSLSIEMYKKSVSLSSYHFIGHTRLCNAYILLGKFDDAYPVCFGVTKYNPDDLAFCNNMGNLYLNAKQYGRALSFYLQALSIDPNLPEVHNNLAVLYYYLNDYKSSTKHFSAAVALGHKVDPEFQTFIRQHQKEQF